MKFLRLILLFIITSSAALAAGVFPGLQKIMTEAEWKRAGLDKLTPDQIGVIDAALIKYTLQTNPSFAASQPTPSQPPSGPTPGATAAETAVARSRFWEKFGLGKPSNSGDWRSQPPMAAKVTGWQGANRFVLDTGQVWEGVEAIPFEMLGQTITIEARPMGAFALKLNEDSVAVRVRRVK